MAQRNIFQRIFNINPTQTKQSNMMGYFGVGTQDAKVYKYQDLAKEGYLKNAIVYRCVNEISKGASAVPFIVKAGDQILEEHPLIDLLKRPNPLQSYSEFFNSLFGYVLLSGNAYILKVGAEQGTPKELHQLRPDRIVIKGSGNSIPDKYQYILNGRVQHTYEVDQENGFSELKHIKLWNPLDDYYGLSPMSAAAVEIDQFNLSSKHNVNLLQNGARPSGAVIFKPQDDAGFAVNLTESQRQQLLTDLNNRFSGTANAGRPLLLEGDFDWREMGLSPKDMDFLNLKHMSATDIAMCFGVPSQLVGVPDAQTYSNVAEARLALYEETIIPHLRKLASDLNEWLVPMFDDRLMLEFDIDSIPALSERRRKIYENVTSAVREGIMTRNEAREIIGLQPVDGADDLYISATLFPLTDESVDKPKDPVNEEDLKEYEDNFDDYDDFSMEEEKNDLTNFPKSGDNKKISLRNSNYPQFSYEFASNVKNDGPKGIWRAGGNIRGNEAYMLWGRARDGSESPAVLKWIKEREAWAARHFRDGQKFKNSSVQPNLSNVAGVVAQIKWGVVGTLGEQGMKDVILELTKKLEGKKQMEDFEPLEEDTHIAIPEDTKQLSAKIKEALKKKVDEHNEKYGDNSKKRATLRMLSAVFKRGVGAYNTNPSSVRPAVRASGGADRWAYARVNSFLFALRKGRYQGGKHDSDLFPKGHPLSSKT
ncbi:MAG: putative portal protein [Prokaryotic dsDNA virus sp.]|nr:MAG: putative portal protein [Prokaryotic dsDNA virus sp.]|tara:strand:- start:253 stop:2373 length:2121 start_codon:yes stop_codon:yes gene_type:complete